MTSNLPTIALSIRQPWAWLIVNGYKPLENRDSKIGSHIGPTSIHASATMTLADFEACWLFLRASFPADFCNAIRERMPLPDKLPRGGIVGQVTIEGISFITGMDGTELFGPWWTGPFAYHLKDAKPTKFIPCKGRLGFFKPNL